MLQTPLSHLHLNSSHPREQPKKKRKKREGEEDVPSRKAPSKPYSNQAGVEKHLPRPSNYEQRLILPPSRSSSLPSHASHNLHQLITIHNLEFCCTPHSRPKNTLYVSVVCSFTYFHPSAPSFILGRSVPPIRTGSALRHPPSSADRVYGHPTRSLTCVVYLYLFIGLCVLSITWTNIL
jgi:hypothetical protein